MSCNTNRIKSKKSEKKRRIRKIFKELGKSSWSSNVKWNLSTDMREETTPPIEYTHNSQYTIIYGQNNTVSPGQWTLTTSPDDTTTVATGYYYYTGRTTTTLIQQV